MKATTLAVAVLAALSTQVSVARADDAPVAADRRGQSDSPVAKVKDGAKTGAHAVGDAARAVGHGTRDAAKAVGHATRDAAHGVGKATRKAWGELTGRSGDKGE
ncbi:MAG: hypothetical protein ACM33T_03405 [Solirubrobacterales bacterium]